MQRQGAPRKSVAKKRTTKLHNVVKKRGTTLISQKRRFSNKKQQTSSEESEISSSTETDSSDDVPDVARGPMMPELYALGLQLDLEKPSFFKNAKNRDQYLSTISQRMLDKHGMFLRTSPPLLHLVPNYYKEHKLDPRVMYFQKGDVEVFVAPISQPDEVARNHKMIDGLLDTINFDNVIIPLTSKPDSFKPYDNPFQRMSYNDIKYDIFDPEGSPKPPKIIGGTYSAIETPQYAAYKAYDMDLDITLSGRLEFVSLNNWKFKATQYPDGVSHETANRAIVGKNLPNDKLVGALSLNILPHTPPLDVLAEISLNFEPALVATAAIRSTIEEQQRIVDDARANQDDMTKPVMTKRVLAIIDTAQLRHFENVYDLMPILRKEDFSYLKRGFEEWFREMGEKTLGDMVEDVADGRDSLAADSDSSSTSSDSEADLKSGANKSYYPSAKALADPSQPQDQLLQRTRYMNYVQVRRQNPSLRQPPNAIHRIYTSLYGPLADPRQRACGRCRFDIDEFGLYDSSSYCERPTLMSKFGLSLPNRPKGLICSKPFDWNFNPEAIRFPPFDTEPSLTDTIVPNLYQQWMALRHGLVDYEKSMTKGNKKEQQIHLDNILQVQQNITHILHGHMDKLPTKVVRDADMVRNDRRILGTFTRHDSETDSDEDRQKQDNYNSDEFDDDAPKKSKVESASPEELAERLATEKFLEEYRASKKKEGEATATPSPKVSKKKDETSDDDDDDQQQQIVKKPEPKQTTPTPPTAPVVGTPAPSAPEIQHTFLQEFIVTMTQDPIEQHINTTGKKYNDFRKITDVQPHNLAENQQQPQQTPPPPASSQQQQQTPPPPASSQQQQQPPTQ